MPCRRGCSPPRPGPVCCCAQRRCSGRHRRHRDGEQFCTADTCSNPEFCITYRPQFCPHGPSPTNQENPDAEPPQFGRWPPPPPFPDITPWPPPSPHSHPLSSTLNLHSQHSIPSLPSLAPHPGNQQYPYSTPSGNPIRRKSTARLSIGKPSLTRLDGGNNTFETGLSRPDPPDSLCAMRQRRGSIGGPSITYLDDLCYGQTDQSNFRGSYPSPNGAGLRYGDLTQRCPQRGGGAGRGSRAQPIGRFQQARQPDENAFESDRPERERCECRMPPEFARYRCTGNLSGLCDCPHCDDNK